MRFQTPLVPARLVRRYKRFLADVVLDDGREVTAHCPNPGAMTGLDAAGSRIWLEPNADPKKKLRFGWRLSELPDGGWAGIDAMLPNRIVGEALASGRVPALAAAGSPRAEVAYGQRSRVDFLLTDGAGRRTWLEVKNVHLSRRPGLAEFPDCPTARGARHLRELAAVARQGDRAAVLYLVQRTDCRAFGLADDVDPDYAEAAADAAAAGVETLCHVADISLEGIEFGRALPLATAPGGGAG